MDAVLKRLDSLENEMSSLRAQHEAAASQRRIAEEIFAQMLPEDGLETVQPSVAFLEGMAPTDDKPW
jgi:hypothetical protein